MTYYFISVLECLDTGGGPCATSPSSLLLYFAIGALLVAGWWASRRDADAFRAVVRRGILIGLGLTVLSFLVIAGFVMLDPHTAFGLNDDALMNGALSAAANALALGAMIVLGMSAFCVAGWASARLGSRGNQT